MGVAAVAVVALLAFAWRPAIAPIAPPAPTSFPRELVENGERLASAGNCIDCHTAPGGPANAGGKPTRTKVGNFYSTNLTPDPETGLGRWSEADIIKAVRTGVRPDGRQLVPIMPYHSYGKLSDADARALASYLKSLKPVRNQVPGPVGPSEKPSAPYLTVIMPQ